MTASDDDRLVASARASLLETSRHETQLTTRDFTHVADEPRDGERGAGPTATEYLLMALASCTAITIRSYADYKYDYAGNITVDVALREPRTPGAARYLQRTITFTEQVPEPDLQTMMDIVERTPVTLLLASAGPVRTEFRDLPDSDRVGSSS